jgi:hypothetical protein
MINGQNDFVTSKLAKRIDIISSMDHILKESIYYRTHSQYFIEENKTVIANINHRNNKKTIL